MSITTPSTSTPIQLLPRITIQPTFLDVVNDIKQGLHAAEDSWISVYSEELGFKSIHGRCRITEKDDEDVDGKTSTGRKVEFKGRDGVVVKGISNTEFEISSSPNASTSSQSAIPPTPVHFPSSNPYTLRSGIEAFDISSDGLKFLVGGKDGIVRVGDIRSGLNVRELKGHVGDIKDVKFFPSNEVALTSSIDMSLRVFAIEDGSNPRTLLGHTATITSTYIHKKGKTVLSSSMDGTLRIWNVGTGLVVDVIRFTLPITYMIIGKSPRSGLSTTSGEGMEVEEGEGEGLEGRIAILGHSNGSASIYNFPSSTLSTTTTSTSDPPTNLRTLKSHSASPITSIAYDSNSALILLGSREGTISIFDISSISSSSLSVAGSLIEDILPICRFRRSDSSITSINFSSLLPSSTPSPTQTILIASTDGLPYRIALKLPLNSKAESQSEGEGIKVKVIEEFAGIDCDSVIIREGNLKGEVWVGGIDGVLRRYVSSRY